MKIWVIGNKGVVGSATSELLKRLGYDVDGNDIGEEIAKGPDIYIICTQEDAVHEVVERLWHQTPVTLQGNDRPLIVIRSTVPVGTCDELWKRNRRLHICHWPEHLREATSLWDCYFPEFISFGECCTEHGDLLESMMKPMGVPILRSDVITSEASKLAINNIKSVLISYWNEFLNLGKQMGFNAHLAARIAAFDPVVPNYGTVLGGAYGGKCLPKDIIQTIKIYEDLNMDPHLLKAALQVNEEVKEAFGESKIRTG